ncbi:MAG: hypothetical protein LAN70_01470 [Acidobacteriia bacterium]|nr:hypothetical protein [Terriglobia bacterium]
MIEVHDGLLIEVGRIITLLNTDFGELFRFLCRASGAPGAGWDFDPPLPQWANEFRTSRRFFTVASGPIYFSPKPAQAQPTACEVLSPAEAGLVLLLRATHGLRRGLHIPTPAAQAVNSGRKEAAGKAEQQVPRCVSRAALSRRSSE